MNASVVCKANVTEGTLDLMSTSLPAIFSEVLEVPGGNLAPLKPEQVSLMFSQASPRDVGSEIKILIFAKRNDPRISTENKLAKTILEKLTTLIKESGEQYSIDIRLYLMEIGTAEFALSA